MVPQILDGPIQEEAPVLTSGTQNFTILHDGLWEKNMSLLIARNHWCCFHYHFGQSTFSLAKTAKKNRFLCEHPNFGWWSPDILVLNHAESLKIAATWYCTGVTSRRKCPLSRKWRTRRRRQGGFGEVSSLDWGTSKWCDQFIFYKELCGNA